MEEKSFLRKLATSKILFEPKWCKCSWNIPIWIEWFQWQGECIDIWRNIRMHYNHGKVQSSNVMNSFKQSNTFVDSGSPEGICFSCLVAKNFIFLFILYALSYVYHQGYVCI